MRIMQEVRFALSRPGLGLTPLLVQSHFLLRVELSPVCHPLKRITVGLRIALVVYETAELFNGLVGSIATANLGRGRGRSENVYKKVEAVWKIENLP